MCHKLWEPSECSKSSTWRELAAIDFSLESFAPILKGSLVKWFTDSRTAARIIEVGSMKLDLHRLAVKIFQFCAKHSIRLEVQRIPRTENEKADYISCLIDFDDWQITHDLFLSFYCCSRYPLSEPTDSDGYSCSPIMAFVQFFASSDEQISVVH